MLLLLLWSVFYIYIVNLTAYIPCIFVDFMLNLLTPHNLKLSAPQNIF